MDLESTESNLQLTNLSRSLEKILDDAVYTGELHLGFRKLKDLSFLTSYDLSDTVYADLCKNKLSEFPREICNFVALERLLLYHNVIRSVPDAVKQLKSLIYLNLSCNQLSFLPLSLCTLPNLEILNLCNNKLFSLPQEISQFKSLIDMDLSCNQLSVIPKEIGQIKNLRYLKLRKNHLIELPKEISNLKLFNLDISYNNLNRLPLSLREMTCMTEFDVHCNPLEVPPVFIANKGLLHIMKYLMLEAIKEERRRGVMSEFEIRNKFGNSVLFYGNSQFNKRSAHFQNQKTIDPKFVNDLSLAERNAYDDKESSKGTISQSELSTAESPVLASSINLTDEFSLELARQKSEYEKRKLHAQSLKRHLIQQYSESDLERQKLRDQAKQNHADQLAMLEKRREDARRRLMASPWRKPENPNSDGSASTDNDHKFHLDFKLLLNSTQTVMASNSQKNTHCESTAESKKIYELSKPGYKITDSGNVLNPNETISACQSPSFPSSEDIPSFTIRRHLQQIQEEIRLLDKLRRTIESVLKVSLPDNLSLALSDGVVLCHLTNQIHPTMISSIHVPSPAVPQLSLAKCRRNVENFIEACKSLGISQSELCSPQDIIEAKNTCKVARTVELLIKAKDLKLCL